MPTKKKKKKELTVYLYIGEGNGPFPPVTKAYVGSFQDIMDVVEDYREKLRKQKAKLLFRKKVPSSATIKRELASNGIYSEIYHFPKSNTWIELRLTTKPVSLPFHVRLIDLRKIGASSVGRYHPIVWR